MLRLTMKVTAVAYIDSIKGQKLHNKPGFSMSLGKTLQFTVPRLQDSSRLRAAVTNRGHKTSRRGCEITLNWSNQACYKHNFKICIAFRFNPVLCFSQPTGSTYEPLFFLLDVFLKLSLHYFSTDAQFEFFWNMGKFSSFL